MGTVPRPAWSEHAPLADLLAGWRAPCRGRELFGVTVGADWLRLHLAGEAQDAILLTDLPGARLVLACRGRLDEPLRAALAPLRKHPLRDLLNGARLLELGMLPEDRVAAFALGRPDGSRVHLMHRLFGARGNTVLLDDDGRLLWARHRPPHGLLTVPPPAATWSTGCAGPDELSAPALDHLTATLADRLARERRTLLQRRLRAAERLAANLARDLDNAERGQEHRRRAEALAANLHTVRQGQDAIEVADLRDGAPLLIPLDPAVPPAVNLDAWFRRARKAERGHEVIATRHAAALAEAAVLTEALAQEPSAGLAAPERLAAVVAWRGAHTDLMAPATGPGRARAAEEPARPFRRYRLEERWEVWIGRNNRENDELTHRASHGRDLWFHAQGVPGSHVILRTAGKPERVPRPIIAKAAALAALHSKARHAQLVPVVWTERRYVRRPRKAPAGTAICLREESIFVEPGVPAGAEPI